MVYLLLFPVMDPKHKAMHYKIHNEKSIESKEARRRVRKIIDRQFPRIERLAGNYPKTLLVNIYINKRDRVSYDVSSIIKMREGIVFVKEKGDNIESILHILFDKLRIALNRKINKERKEYLRKKKAQDQLIFDEHLEELRELKETETRETFNQLLKILSSDVARYIRRRIKSAEMTTAIKKGKFKLQEILDEIYLLVYERLEEIGHNKQDTNIWLYKLADEILERQFREIEFERDNLERLTEIVEAEYAGGEEEYTIDAEEEIIPLEELDEYDRQSDLNMATGLYAEDEDSLLDELTLKINRQEINRILEKELAKLPVFERSIMDFFLINQMSAYEIAEIKKIPEPEIEELTGRLSRDLKEKLEHAIQGLL